MDVSVNAGDGVTVRVGEGRGVDGSDSDAETRSSLKSGRVLPVSLGFEQATTRKASRTTNAGHFRTFDMKSRALLMGGHRTPR